MPQSETPAMDSDTVASLVEIVTDPRGTAKSLSAEEQKVYEEAKKSVIEARFQTEPHEGQIRIL